MPEHTRPSDPRPRKLRSIPRLPSPATRAGGVERPGFLGGHAMMLQRTVGNAATCQLLTGRGQHMAKTDAAVRRSVRLAEASLLAVQRDSSTIDFTDTPTVATGYRVDVAGVYAEANEIYQLHRAMAVDLKANTNAAIKMFTDYMQFAADEEAVASGANAASTFIRKALIDHYLGKAIGPLVELVPAVGQAKDLAEALLAEADRAQKAAGSVKIRNYLVNLNLGWNAKVDKLSKSLDGMADRIHKQYSNIANPNKPRDRKTLETLQEGRTIITGPGAEFLADLKRRAEAARETQPTAESMLNQIVFAFAKSEEGEIKSFGGSDIRTSGQMIMETRATIEGDSISMKGLKTAYLVAPNAAKTASALNGIMHRNKWTIHDLPIRKSLKVRVEHEVPWSNDYYTVNIGWTTQGSESIQILGSLHNDHGFRVPSKIRRTIVSAWQGGRLGTIGVRSIEAYS